MKRFCARSPTARLTRSAPHQRLLGDFLDFALTQPHFYSLLLIDRREDARQFPTGFDAYRWPTFSHAVRIVDEGMQKRS